MRLDCGISNVDSSVFDIIIGRLSYCESLNIVKTAGLCFSGLCKALQ